MSSVPQVGVLDKSSIMRTLAIVQGLVLVSHDYGMFDLDSGEVEEVPYQDFVDTLFDMEEDKYED